MINNKISLFAKIFFALYIILPSYLAVEISINLPLITASRIILIFVTVYYIAKNKGKIKLNLFKCKKDKYNFFMYSILMFISNLY